MSHRMSSLPVAQYCGRSATLGAKYGAGRRAIMGRAFHAECAGDPSTAQLMLGLSPAERNELLTWHKPADVEVGGETLRYEDAVKEQEVHIGIETPTSIVGHVDFYWIAGNDLFVGDIKATKWTTSGPDSLQMLAYGLGLAMAHGCDRFTCGLWIATDGEWQWMDRFIEMTEADALYWRIKAAAEMEDEAITGEHCENCYGRMHCNEYLLPAEFGSSDLASLAEPGYVLTNDVASWLVHIVQRQEKVVAVAKKQLQEFARRQGGIKDPETGKVWAPTEQQGRESVLSVKDLREQLGSEAEQYISRGKPFNRFMWRKA